MTDQILKDLLSSKFSDVKGSGFSGQIMISEDFANKILGEILARFLDAKNAETKPSSSSFSQEELDQIKEICKSLDSKGIKLKFKDQVLALGLGIKI